MRFMVKVMWAAEKVWPGSKSLQQTCDSGTAEDVGTEGVYLTAFKMCYMTVLVTLPLLQAML